MTDNEIELGMHVRTAGHPTVPDGIVGIVRHPLDEYGRVGVVPDEPYLVKGKRGRARGRNPIWLESRFVEPLLSRAATPLPSEGEP